MYALWPLEQRVRPIFVWDFPHFVKACKIYLFVYLSTRKNRLSRGFWRSVSLQNWISINVSIHRIVQPFSAVGFWRTYTEFHICFLGPFISKVHCKDKPFSIFTGSLHGLTLQFCCGSPKICLHN